MFSADSCIVPLKRSRTTVVLLATTDTTILTKYLKVKLSVMKA